MDFKDLEQANKAAKTIDELELTLAERTDELKQCMEDLAVFEQTCLQMEETKMQMMEELEEATAIMEERETRINEQD